MSSYLINESLPNQINLLQTDTSLSCFTELNQDQKEYLVNSNDKEVEKEDKNKTKEGENLRSKNSDGFVDEQTNDSASRDDHYKADKPRPSYLFQPNCHIFGGCVDDDASDEFFISSGINQIK